MRTIPWLALVAFLVPSVGRADDKTDAALATAARAVVTALVKEDFKAAARDFDAAMLKALPPDKLAAIWKDLLAKTGAFQKTTAIRHEKVDKIRVAVVTCQFEKTALDMRIAFDADQKVAGLFFVPSKPPEYQAPAYVQRDAFTDTDVKFGADDWVLSGTVSLPKGPGPFPAVVLVHGSGPHDRDETIGPNRPFRDLGWGLASRGIAVLRYEKRTKEHAARMAKLADVTVKEEVLDDALAAVKLLQKTPKIDPKKVFIVGHSLGAMLAPRLGELDPSLAGLVLLAGPTRPIEELLLEQYLYLAELNEVPMRAVDAIKEQLAKLRDAKPDTPAAELPLGVPLSYWRSLHQADPTKIAPKLTLPLLLLQGERDYQVTMTDFAGWQKLLKGRKNAELKTYPKLNHLLVAGAGKSKPAEYQQEGHVDKEIIDDIAAWVKKQ